MVQPAVPGFMMVYRGWYWICLCETLRGLYYSYGMPVKQWEVKIKTE